MARSKINKDHTNKILPSWDARQKCYLNDKIIVCNNNKNNKIIVANDRNNRGLKAFLLTSCQLSHAMN